MAAAVPAEQAGVTVALRSASTPFSAAAAALGPGPAAAAAAAGEPAASMDPQETSQKSLF